MLMRALLLFITLNAVSTDNCLGMELTNTASINNKSDEVAISLNTGLFTVIPGKTIKEGTEHKSIFESGTTIEKIDTRNDTLLNLLYYNVFLGYKDRPYTREYFAPYIIKINIEKSNTRIENREQLHNGYSNCKKLRREVKEAVRERKALYWSYKQGVIIYSLEEQPKPSIVKHVKSLLNSRKNSITITEQ